MEVPKLTQFSPGAGCGCKISLMELETILKSGIEIFKDPNLMVGNESKDDAAVYKVNEEIAIISTTDFFTPIVDDPFDFGRISATNAISDIYAMGGKPIMAIAILGWPLEKLSSETARLVTDGARQICNEAGISLAGGHSIEITDPIFGLAVTGIANPMHIRQNNKATEGCSLFLTKPIGIGITTTAEKRGIVLEAHKKEVVRWMTTLNSAGSEFSKYKFVRAMTDVTGFGLLGHLLEICEGSQLGAEIEFDSIPLLDGLMEYIENKAVPGGTFRNWKSYGSKIQELPEMQKKILCDPQTSGGLLVAVENEGKEDFIDLANRLAVKVWEIGSFKQYSGYHYIKVK